MAGKSPFAAVFLLFFLVASVSGHGSKEDDENSPDKPDLRAKELILVKIWCLILVFAGTFIGGISPYFLKWNESFLVLGTQFAGGVFLGTSMMHFLSDSNETFGDLTDVEYPFAFMLACAGYLLTMASDVVISFLYGRREERGDAENGGAAGSSQVSKYGGYGHTHSNVQLFGPGPCTLAEAGIGNVSSLGDSILLIVALCFHSVFEGIAIGVAETKDDAWRVLWTVCLHKIFAAIALGIALLRMIPERPLLSCSAYAFAFAISSPIGVVIGIVIDATTQGTVADWIYAISMGLACGIFIYVSINHLLSKGYAPQKPALVDSPFYKFLAVLLGVTVIAIVMIWDT
ncbi:hypothetical protein AMTRI_Chr10g227190 [Amborella trichopoda]